MKKKILCIGRGNFQEIPAYHTMLSGIGYDTLQVDHAERALSYLNAGKYQGVFVNSDPEIPNKRKGNDSSVQNTSEILMAAIEKGLPTLVAEENWKSDFDNVKGVQKIETSGKNPIEIARQVKLGFG